MKKTWTSLAAVLWVSAAHASEDTLKNHEPGSSLIAGKYTDAGTWGYHLGHNHLKQQQYAEKYYLDHHTHVLGVVVHLAGTVTNTGNEAFTRIFEAGPDGLPGNELEHAHADFGNLDLEGGPNIFLFHHEAHAEDSFFVSFDLGDYAHGGQEGDTIGLLYAPDGSRKAADLAKFCRNLIQEHGHGAANWSDIHTQSFLNLATHLAIYPLIEFEEDHTGVGGVASKSLSLSAPYPNPARTHITIPYTLAQGSGTSITVTDVSGKTVLTSLKPYAPAGSYTETLDISRLTTGVYHLVIRTDNSALAVRISKT